MSSIDNRVVEMEFDNKQFEAGIKDTLNSLEALKEGLKLEGAAKGLTDIEAASKNVRLDGMASALDNISSKFSVMGAIGFTVIQDLTRAAGNFIKGMAGKVLDPLIGGGRRRAENIEQAKFQFRGLGMDIEATMASALEAVTGTAYGLDEAAKAAGQFGASGMRAGDDMTSALRAISGVAAMTNSSYEDIAQVFTKVAGNGRVMGDDLLRMSSRGLNAAATLADAFNMTEAEIREMVTDGEVSFEMFYQAMDQAFGENATKANETYAGSLANLRAAFSRIGANFFTPWLEQQRDLFNALSPAVDGVGKALKPVITQLTNFTRIRTDSLIDFINGLNIDRVGFVLRPIAVIISNIARAIGQMIQIGKDAFRNIFPPMAITEISRILRAVVDFTAGLKMGGETAAKVEQILGGFFAIFGIGWELLKGVAKFLGEIFGIVGSGSSGFLDAAANIGQFLINLHWAIKEGEGLTNFFSGLADLLRRPIGMIKDLAAAFLSLFDFDAPSVGRLGEMFEPMGRLGAIAVTVINSLIDSAKRVWAVFQPLGRALADFFKPITEGIKNAFDDLNFDEVRGIINSGLLVGILAMFRRFADNLSNSFGSIQYNLTEPFKRLTFTLTTMQNTLRAMTLMQIAIAVGLLAASVVALSTVDAAGLTRALGAMTVMFTQLFASLKVFTMIGGVQGLVGIGAGLILFAVAVRILVGAVKKLSGMEWEELVKGLTGVGVLITTLAAAVKIMSGNTAGMISAGAGLLILAFGIKVLVGAVTDLAGLSWEEMAKGLVGVGGLLASLAIFTRLVAANKAGLLQGAGLLLLATGIRVLSDAVSIFAAMSWEEIGKGLTTVAGILAAFAAFSQLLDPSGLIRAGISLVLIAGAMHILADALAKFATMSWEEIGKGLTTMAGALISTAIALRMMPPSTLASAAAIGVVALSLGLIADALQRFGGMSWEEIGKGLATLASALGLIAIAMLAMKTALPGAAATLVVAAALRMLVPVLQTFGSMPWEELVKGLAMLAGVFVVLGLAGLVLAPVAPVLLTLGIAIAAIGLGTALAGAGVLALATALTALAAAGAAGTAALVAMAAGLIGLIPMLAEQLGYAVVAFAEVIATAGPQILAAMITVLDAVIMAVQETSPKIVDTFIGLVTLILAALVDLIPKAARAMYQIMIGVLQAAEKYVPTIVKTFINLVVKVLQELAAGVPRFVTAAVDLMVAFLQGIEDNIGRVITAGADIIIAVIEGIDDNMQRIVESGIKAIISFINGVADAIRDNTAALQRAGRNLATAIISGLTGGLTDKIGAVASKAREVASSAVESAKNFFRISSPSRVFRDIGRDVGDGLAIGLEGSIPVVEKATHGMGNSALDVMRDTMKDLNDMINIDADMDLSPKVRPVLDLSEIRKDAKQIGTMVSGHDIRVDAALVKAKNVATRHEARREAEFTPPTRDILTPAPVIEYNQNNYSPKALSTAEIYRQTRNQLSISKGALSPNASS